MTRLPSIRRRLLVALMLMTLLTLAVASGLSALMDLRLFRDHMLRDLRVLAAVVGESCVSALVFNSKESAEQRLATLAGEYQIRSATLFDASGQPFARWQRPPGTSRTGVSAGAGVEIVHPLSFDGRAIGRLLLSARLDELDRQTRTYAWLAGGVALMTLTIALAMALGLQRRVARPILALEDAIRAVAARQDFSLRVPVPRTEREIEALGRAFNDMLEQIERRETALQQSNDALRQTNEILRRLSSDLSMLEETEKARLADELHDGPMQKLALALMQIDAGAARAPGVPGDDAEAEQQLAAGINLMRETIGELQTLQFTLSPPVLHQRGLPEALDWLASDTRERYGISVVCRVAQDLPALDRRHSTLLFRCARELVNNLVKHSGARNGAIELQADGEVLELAVCDDGRGFEPPRPGDSKPSSGGGYGLHSIRERLELLGGSLGIRSTAAGSRVVVRLPIASH